MSAPAQASATCVQPKCSVSLKNGHECGTSNPAMPFLFYSRFQNVLYKFGPIVSLFYYYSLVCDTVIICYTVAPMFTLLFRDRYGIANT